MLDISGMLKCKHSFDQNLWKCLEISKGKMHVKYKHEQMLIIVLLQTVYTKCSPDVCIAFTFCTEYNASHAIQTGRGILWNLVPETEIILAELFLG